jgi:uncharacterized membrane protein YfcA
MATSRAHAQRQEPPIASLFGTFVLPLAAAGGTMMAVAAAGIDSLLVPLFSLEYDFKLAVASIALPHFTAGALRTWQLRKDIQRRLFLRFGIVCALASFAGALVQERFDTDVITYVFAALLVVSGLLGFTGILERKHQGKAAAWIAGGASGFFGGLCGEQGGLRAVGLMGLGLSKEEFVATGAAVGVLGDLMRLPVYAVRQWSELPQTALPTAGAVVGVVLGIFIGKRLLKKLPADRFGRVVSAVIVVVGVLLFFRKP